MKPTKPGFYWFKNNDKWQVAEVLASYTDLPTENLEFCVPCSEVPSYVYQTEDSDWAEEVIKK